MNPLNEQLNCFPELLTQMEILMETEVFSEQDSEVNLQAESAEVFRECSL